MFENECKRRQRKVLELKNLLKRWKNLSVGKERGASVRLDGTYSTVRKAHKRNEEKTNGDY